MKHLPELLRQRLRVLYHSISLRDILVVFLLNTVSALLNALHYLIADGAGTALFLASISSYVKVFNLLGFALMFAYFLVSPGPDKALQFGRVVFIGVLAFVISLPLSFLMFDWGHKGVHPLFEASTYLAGNLLLAAWAIFVIVYIKRREARQTFRELRHEIRRTAEQRDRAEMELHLLQAQLEPHFFFNTLANLHNLIDIDRERAKHLLEELTVYLRASIPQFRQRFITLGDELEVVRRYLNIQKIRYGEKLSFAVRAPTELAGRPVLPMSLLTLVENAIKHGIEKSRHGGSIEVQVDAPVAGRLRLLVKDSGGQLGTHDSGTGLANLRARLERAYGAGAQFTLTLEDACTLATLEVPDHV